ncbi:SPFH domain-containing protein [Turicimonas muris]|uniref:Paraslipin n=4 Tax=Turicimonas muris TaxID=1796652 RepID=A0A227KI79_9BURK|nr:SPFH domain-containing protein [Turicimonas muris]ANU66662.1 paraslipin [Burkholderiales bacterium YL45]MBS4768633.1 SPFH/Band 7/PHB domain protein [Burkholderiales bacterium]OXE47309.1 paraslipin [Turicimonas muris]QQQ97810.1 SPFH/Band 7/PHB domain protein [Turicimonas muris]
MEAENVVLLEWGALIPVLIIFAVIFIYKSVKVVPQQDAWVVERFGKFNAVLQPGLNFIIPLIDKIAYRHSLKEIPLDTSSQICITKDNTQLQVDGVLYFQVTNPELASYGTSDYVMAITQLAQTSLRSVIGTMSLDKTFEERDEINARVVQAVDEAAQTWGVKVLRYEIKDLTPPKEILRAMQLQITAEREKRAVVAASEGQKQKEINIAEGNRAALIAQSEGEKQAAINKAEGEARAIEAVAKAQAEAIRVVADSIAQPSGIAAVNLQVAEKYVEAFGNVAKTNNTMLLPANFADMGSMIATAMTIVKETKDQQ